MTPAPTLDDFLDLGFSDNLRHVLRVTADRDDLKAITAHRKDGKLNAQAWTSLPRQWPHDVTAVWLKPAPVRGKSKTMQAVEMVLNDGLTVYAAAKKVGVQQAAVHRAIQRREEKPICPCCSQIVRAGFYVNPDVLKIPRSR